MNIEQKNQVVHRCTEVIRKAESLYNFKFGAVAISFKLKGRCAGRAIGRNLSTATPSFEIQLNLEALELDWNNMMDDTIPHEIAHLVCFKFPKLGNHHNRGWARVCIALGGDGSRTHSLKLTPGRKTRKFLYLADCGTEVTLSSVIHNKLQRGQQNFRILRATGGRIFKTGLLREVA